MYTEGLHTDISLETPNSASLTRKTDDSTDLIVQGQTQSTTTLASQSIYDLRVPIFLCIATSFAGFIFGWDVGTIGGISNFQTFRNRFGTSINPITGEAEFDSLLIGLIIAIFNIGCAIGGLTLPKISDFKGRKVAIFISLAIYVVGLVIQLTSTLSGAWAQILIGRITTGFAVGSTSVLTPMFISESAPLKIRGAMVVLYQLMITAGIFAGNLTCYCCKKYQAHSNKQWMIPIALGFVWAFLIIIGTLYMPESAVFKISRHDDVEGAKRSIAKLNNISSTSHVCQEEVEKIIANKKFVEEQTNHNGEWHEFITGEPKLGFRLVIGIFVMFFQQFSGANYFFYYGTSLFSSVGIEDSYITAMILGSVNFVATFFGIYLVEKFGRKSCLLWGSALMFTTMIIYSCLGSFALLNEAGEERRVIGFLMIVFTCIYVIGFATTWGPVAFVVVSEIFPVKVKATSMAISTSINWTSNFLISLFTPFITKKIGYKLGLVFAGCLILSFFFVWFFVPETKGLRIEEVDEYFRTGKGVPSDEENDDEVVQTVVVDHEAAAKKE